MLNIMPDKLTVKVHKNTLSKIEREDMALNGKNQYKQGMYEYNLNLLKPIEEEIL